VYEILWELLNQIWHFREGRQLIFIFSTLTLAMLLFETLVGNLRTSKRSLDHVFSFLLAMMMLASAVFTYRNFAD
jgi:hypothetical protein